MLRVVCTGNGDGGQSIPNWSARGDLQTSGGRPQGVIVIWQWLFGEIATQNAAVWNGLTVIHNDEFHCAGTTVSSDVPKTGSSAQNRIHSSR